MEYTYKYPRLAVTADCMAMTKEATPQVVLIKRGADPYKGCWAFPTPRNGIIANLGLLFTERI